MRMGLGKEVKVSLKVDITHSDEKNLKVILMYFQSTGGQNVRFWSEKASIKSLSRSISEKF